MEESEESEEFVNFFTWFLIWLDFIFDWSLILWWEDWVSQTSDVFFGNILHRFEATLSCLDKNMCRPFRSHVCSTWKANAKEALPGIPSMGLVYLPTWMVDFYGFHAGKYIDIHGWYGIRSVPQPVFFVGPTLFPYKLHDSMIEYWLPLKRSFYLKQKR